MPLQVFSNDADVLFLDINTREVWMPSGSPVDLSEESPLLVPAMPSAVASLEACSKRGILTRFCPS